MIPNRFLILRMFYSWILLCCGFMTIAQTDLQLSSNWDYTVPDGSSEKIHKIITAFDGSLVAVGETINTNKRDADGLLAIYDSKTGNRLMKQQFGGVGQDGFKSIVQNFDGTFTVVGYTTTKKQRHSWIMLLDKQGTLLKGKRTVKSIFRKGK